MEQSDLGPYCLQWLECLLALAAHNLCKHANADGEVGGGVPGRSFLINDVVKSYGEKSVLKTKQLEFKFAICMVAPTKARIFLLVDLRDFFFQI